jgi:hypothetical protein
MFDNIFTQYSINFDGLTVYSLSGASIGSEYPTLVEGGYASVTQSIPAETKIVFTGRFFETQKGNICYQILYYTATGSYYGYVWGEDLNGFTKIPGTSEGIKSVNLINEIISNNQYILENNLICARMFDFGKQYGIVFPNTCRVKLYNLQQRLIARNEKLKDSNYISKYEEGVSPDLSSYNQILVNWMNNPGIGIVITGGAIIVISVIIIAAVSAAAYAIFKPSHTESVKDFKYSDELMAEMAKYLPPDLFEKFVNEHQKILEKVNNAINNASGKSIFTTLKYLAVGFAGFYLVDKFLATRKN